MDAINTDIHRIISLSVEKIASERIQRGGVKLHRGLMLANVIYNAKHLAVHRSKKFLLELSYSSSNHQNVLESENELDNSNEIRQTNNSRHFTFRSPIKCQSSSKPQKRRNDDDLFTEQIDETSKRSKPHDDDSNYFSSSPSSLLNSFQMCHLNSPSKVDLCDPSLDSSQDQPLQYTTLNTAQLCSEEEEEEEEEDELETSLYQADEDLSSCSTQIREALDMLSRPVISLAV